MYIVVMYSTLYGPTYNVHNGHVQYPIQTNIQCTYSEHVHYSSYLDDRYQRITEKDTKFKNFPLYGNS
jgi:hypothetical protein